MKLGSVSSKQACHHGYTTLSAAPRSVHHLLTNVRLECLPPNQGFGGETALAAAAAAAAAETSDGKSALVRGWFGAQDKELEFVKKIYKKKGFSDVVVHASPIAPARSHAAGTAAWRRSKGDRRRGGADADADAVVRAAEISRPFDVVHVMSGVPEPLPDAHGGRASQIRHAGARLDAHPAQAGVLHALRARRTWRR